MAAPIEHMDTFDEKINFPLRSGASLVNTRPLFSHDNKYLLVCSNTVVKVYSTVSGECVRELHGHKDRVTGIVCHPTNKLQLISCSLDQRLIIWDYADGVLLKEIPLGKKLYGVFTYTGIDSVLVLRQTEKESEGDLVIVKLKKKSENISDTLIHGCSTDCRNTSLGLKGRYVASVKNRRLKIKEINSKNPVITHNLDKGLSFTCVACHPVNECVATGCKDGKIYLWYKFYSVTAVVKTTLHWHSLAVQDLCFTEEGSYLLSGGYECTMVKWHADSRTRDYLPRLGAPINHLACSRDNLMYASCHDDNVILVISSGFVIQQVYQGLTKGHLKCCLDSVEEPVPTGLLCDPRSKALVMNGKPGHIQFFSVHEDRQLYNLDIVGHNYISAENLEKPLTVTEVTNTDFDSGGTWLATTEYWNDGTLSAEIRLKFWQFKEELQSYELNTVVEMAHSDKIVSLRMRPSLLTAPVGLNNMAVTSSEDGKFKIWTLVDDTDIYRSNVKWTCESVGFYRDIPAGETAFSEDGSLLAVVFQDYVTLWDPENNMHKETLFHNVKREPVSHIVFGREACSQYLISCTSTTLTVWDLITCSVSWSVNIKVNCLARDPRSDFLAAFTANKDLFVFRPSNPDPVFSHPAVSTSRILSAVFIPHSKKNVYEKTTLSWQAQSELFFINEKQELQSVSFQSDMADVKTKEDVVEFEHNLPQTALSLIMKGHTNKSEVKDTRGQVTLQPEQKYIREIFSSASHVQPSVTTLCRPFIQSLMIQRLSRSHKRLTDEEDEDSEDELSWQQVKQTDSGVDMETDSIEDQDQSNLTENKPVAQTTMNLRHSSHTKQTGTSDSISKKEELLTVTQEKESNELDLTDLEPDLSWYSEGLTT